MLPASMAPSALPAPTMVCSSSMKRMTWPSCLARSRSTPFRRSSNSPRNFAPAISEPMSSARMRLFFRPSGTSPLTIRCASPSTIAVLPTPGSPISTGLFLVRRCSKNNPDGAADLIVAADHRVELPGRGAPGEVDGVLLERLAAFLRVGVGDLLSAAHLLDGLLHGAAHQARFLEQPRERAILERRQHEELARDELVAALLRELVGDVQHPVQVVGDVYLAGGALDLGQPVEERQQPRAQLVDVGPRLHEQRAHRAARAVEHRQQDVRGLDELMIAAERERLGVGQRLLKAAGELVHAHESSTLGCDTGYDSGFVGTNRCRFKGLRCRRCAYASPRACAQGAAAKPGCGP